MQKFIHFSTPSLFLYRRRYATVLRQTLDESAHEGSSLPHRVEDEEDLYQQGVLGTTKESTRGPIRGFFQSFHAYLRERSRLDDTLEQSMQKLTRTAQGGAAAPSVVVKAAEEVMRVGHSNERPHEVLSVFFSLHSAGLVLYEHLSSLATAALGRRPHHHAQAYRVQQLLHAEAAAPSSSSPIRPRCPLSSCEAFRHRLLTEQRWLHHSRTLASPLSLYVYLTKVREVVMERKKQRTTGESDLLRESVEGSVVYHLSASILWHPSLLERVVSGEFTPAAAPLEERKMDRIPATSTASSSTLTRRLHFLDVYSAAAREALPLNASCLLHSLSTWCGQWDAVLVERALKERLLPTAAHCILPPSIHSPSSSSLFHEVSPESFASATRWIFPSPLSFAFSSEARLHFLLRRRRFVDLLVVDADYLLHHHQRLWEAGRHREIIVTHGVLLELLQLADGSSGGVCSASLSASPQRFAARRVLCELLARALPTAPPPRGDTFTVPPVGRPRVDSPARLAQRLAEWSSSHHSLEEASGGVTLLGLAEELALLERVGRRVAHRGGEDDRGVGDLLSPVLHALCAASPLRQYQKKAGNQASCGDGDRREEGGHPAACGALSAVACARALDDLLSQLSTGAWTPSPREDSEVPAAPVVKWGEEAPTLAEALKRVRDIPSHQLHRQQYRQRRVHYAVQRRRSLGDSSDVPCSPRVSVASHDEEARLAAHAAALVLYPPASGFL